MVKCWLRHVATTTRENSIFKYLWPGVVEIKLHAGISFIVEALSTTFPRPIDVKQVCVSHELPLVLRRTRVGVCD